MGLYKNGKKWWFSVTVNGKRIFKSTGTEKKNLAENIYAKVKTQIVEGKWFEGYEAKLHTFDELMEKYLNEHSAVHKAKESYVNDKCYVRHLSGIFSNLTLDKITPKLINNYMNLRINEGVKPATIKKEVICLSHALNLALKKWQWITFNPCQRVEMPKVHNQIERWLTYEEQERLLNACHDREWLREVILFALNTGMRQGEIRNLAWSDVDFFRKTATLRKTKNKEVRTVPLNQTVINLLQSKCRIVSIKGFVFSQNGSKLTKREVQRQFETAVKRAEIPNFRFHDLRHTFATRLAQSGVDIYTISKLLGHKSIRMTERYSHHCPESLRPGVDMLDRCYKNVIIKENVAVK